MPSYTLKVLEPQGHIKTIRVQFSHAEMIESYITQHQYILIESSLTVAPIKAQKFNLSIFLYELKTLLESGLSLIEALEALTERQHANQDIINGIITCMYEGHAFSAALQKRPEVFPQLLCATIAATEQTGEMAGGIERYLNYSKNLDQLKTKIISASVYPLTLLVIGTLISIFLLFYLVPRFSLMYDELSADLPLASKLLFQWGAFAAKHKLVLAVFIAIFLSAIIYFFYQAKNRLLLIEKIQQIPWIKSYTHLIILSRFYRALSLLLRAGIPIITALKMTTELLPARLASSHALLKQKIQSGEKLSDSLLSQGLTTSISLRLIRAGERNGQIAEMLERSASFHDEELERWIDKLSKLLEPILMLLIGGIIGAIVILLYLPIFDLVGSI